MKENNEEKNVMVVGLEADAKLKKALQIDAEKKVKELGVELVEPEESKGMMIQYLNPQQEHERNTQVCIANIETGEVLRIPSHIAYTAFVNQKDSKWYFTHKKIYKQSSQFVLWASMLHIGGTLGVFFYSYNPFLLFIFPVILVIVYITRQKNPASSKLRFKFQTIHPEFIDDRGGICVIRSGAGGFRLLKFFRLDPVLPMKELILYLFHEQVECSFEIHRTPKGLVYYLGIITEGRKYDALHERFMVQINRIRQFFKKQQITNWNEWSTLSTKSNIL